MNDLDLEHDDALVGRIRETLDAVAAATPMEGEATVMPLRRGERRPRLLFAAAAAVLAVVVAAAVLVSGRDADTTVAVPIPDGPFSALPTGFDAATATPIFSAPGESKDVAAAYVESRFVPGSFGRPTVSVSGSGDSATASRLRWRFGDDTGTLAEGDLLMRRDGERWVVVASTTDSIDVKSVSYDGTRVSGVVRSSSDESMVADVLDWMGEPARRSPRPAGISGASPDMGSAGGPAVGSLTIDVEHRSAPAVVRVMLVGGTVLGVTEFRLDPPPLATHSDFDACFRANTNVEKEPTPDIAARNCAMALEGTVVAEGAAIDRKWQLVASDEPSGHWLTLRMRDQVGMFRLRNEAGPDVLTDPVEQVQVCCAAGEATVVVAVVRNDVSRVRMTTSAGTTVEAEAFVDADRRYAVLVVEPTVEGEEASLEVQLPNDEWVASDGSFSLAVLGG